MPKISGGLAFISHFPYANTFGTTMLDSLNFQASYKLALALLFLPATATSTPNELLASPAKVSMVSTSSGGAELLEPDRAFLPRFRLRDAATAEIKFDVVPSYYLYRDRIRVQGQVVDPQTGSKNIKPKPGTSAAKAMTPLRLSMPPGRFVDDPTFGRVEIFDQSVVLLVDLGASVPDAKSTPHSSAKSPVAAKPFNKFVLTSQGCAAAGVCFPPQQHEFALPASGSKSRDLRTTESGWILPIGATSLGFGRANSPSASAITSK
ncbi:MAG: protein-disulfide reductase DsbD N-terminal domain-containing protein [Aeromicrobium sp.]|nr:protein-disulfide reductase DsbD N-terminal domain-containing protein [Burkholderiales bacterium]